MKSPAEVFKHFAKDSDKVDVIAEVKYDGERTQIHYHNGEVNLYSRNFENQNEKFWYLKNLLEENFKQQQLFQSELFKWKDIDSFILDGEIVFVDAEKPNMYLPFQEMDRK